MSAITKGPISFSSKANLLLNSFKVSIDNMGQYWSSIGILRDQEEIIQVKEVGSTERAGLTFKRVFSITDENIYPPTLNNAL